MSNYTINDSMFKLLFGAVKTAVHNVRVRHAKRRLDRAFEYANRLTDRPHEKVDYYLTINNTFYIRTLRETAKFAFEEIAAKIAVERNENED